MKPEEKAKEILDDTNCAGCLFEDEFIESVTRAIEETKARAVRKCWEWFERNVPDWTPDEIARESFLSEMEILI